MTSQELKDRTKSFAKGCLKLLIAEGRNDKLFWHIEGQLIRSSTSVAANYRAACLAQSRPSFTAKISIVLEEADESIFWLELLEEELEIKDQSKLQELKKEAQELTNIFASTRKRLQGGSGKS